MKFLKSNFWTKTNAHTKKLWQLLIPEFNIIIWCLTYRKQYWEVRDRIRSILLLEVEVSYFWNNFPNYHLQSVRDCKQIASSFQQTTIRIAFFLHARSRDFSFLLQAAFVNTGFFKIGTTIIKRFSWFLKNLLTINVHKKNNSKNKFETMARHEASQKQPPGVKQSGSLSEQHWSP